MKESLLFDEERKRKEAMDNSDWLLLHLLDGSLRGLASNI
jgi:hypothetical protein